MPVMDSELLNNILKCTSISLFLSILLGCDMELCGSRVEQKIVSPDKKINLFIRKKDCGATTSAVFSVFVSNETKIQNKDKPIFVADKVESINISWINSNTALVEYDSARIFSFQNFWVKQIKGTYVEISILERRRN